MVYRWTLGLLAVLCGACFSDPEDVEGTGACADGSSGCVCYGNGTCDPGLVCNPDGNCVATDCEDGRAECPCYGNGTCDAGLMCAGSICQPVSGTGSGSGSDGRTSTTSMSGVTTDDTSGSAEGTTDPSTSGPFPGVTTDTPTGGIPPACVCPDRQACDADGACVPNPYVPCPPEGCGEFAECISSPEGTGVCAPACDGPLDCPFLFDTPTECISGFCVVLCGTNVDCPAPLSICTDDQLGELYCAAPG